MKELIVIGSGGHARVVVDAAKEIGNISIHGVIDINFESDKKEKILNIPIHGGLQYLEKISPDKAAVFLAIGANETRRRISADVNALGFSYCNIVHPKANISDSVKLGHGIFIGAFANIGPDSQIGNHCIVNTLANVEHEVIVNDFCQFGPGSVVCGRSAIGENVFIGAGSTIIEKISISPNVTIGAGAVVIKDITEHNGKYVGVPARKI